MNRKPASSLRTFSGFAFALALIAGVMNLAGTGVSANEAAKDTAAGNCLPDTTPRPVAFENPAELQGTFDCPASDFFASLSARWSFVAE